ncbi:hypothetical protein QYE76_043066 [Lolium multiflorum]|uniref:Uncharacterized protein n=1 Tax=Lolium multiflorum TaxID=4521 RepID=A0AAD8WXX1_LOLMU|nr:hypothetical protein QYE76_043066 [Lolium multiflorum]
MARRPIEQEDGQDIPGSGTVQLPSQIVRDCSAANKVGAQLKEPSHPRISFGRSTAVRVRVSSGIPLLSHL